MAGDTRRPTGLVHVVHPGPHPVDQDHGPGVDQHKHPSLVRLVHGWTRDSLVHPLSDLRVCGLVQLVPATRGARMRVYARAHEGGPTRRTKIENQKIGAEFVTEKKWDPNIGERIGPAWRAVATNLQQREWGSREVAIQIALNTTDIQRRTAKSLIADAIRHGYLDVREQKDHRGHPYQQVRLTKATP